MVIAKDEAPTQVTVSPMPAARSNPSRAEANNLSISSPRPPFVLLVKLSEGLADGLDRGKQNDRVVSVPVTR